MSYTELAKMLVENAPGGIKRVYEDLAQPAVKKLGLALETSVDFLNTGLFPIRLLNANANHYFEKAVKELANKLENVEEEKICPIPLEISVPTFEKLTYTTNENLREMYINLLSKAAVTDTIHQAHPGFIRIIESISSDEALMFQTFRGNTSIPVLRHRMIMKDNPNNYVQVSIHTTLIEFDKELGLLFPKNTAFYFDNLVGLGLVDIIYGLALIDIDEEYQKIDTLYRDSSAEYLNERFNEEKFSTIDYERGHISVTQYGVSFIETCIVPIE